MVFPVPRTGDVDKSYFNGLLLTSLPSLAYAEMRLILARIIFNFDMRISQESIAWMDQKVWNLWKKGPLLVYLAPVLR
jgi:hypothetical protein